MKKFTSDRRVRFLIIGGSSALLEFGIFVGLAQLGLHLIACNILSFSAGLTASFLGYRLWTFAGDHSLVVRNQFTAYVSLAFVNLAATSILISLLSARGAYPWFAKILCMAMVACWNYLLLNRIIFKRREDHRS